MADNTDTITDNAGFNIILDRMLNFGFNYFGAGSNDEGGGYKEFLGQTPTAFIVGGKFRWTDNSADSADYGVSGFIRIGANYHVFGALRIATTIGRGAYTTQTTRPTKNISPSSDATITVNKAVSKWVGLDFDAGGNIYMSDGGTGATPVWVRKGLISTWAAGNILEIGYISHITDRTDIASFSAQISAFYIEYDTIADIGGTITVTNPISYESNFYLSAMGDASIRVNDRALLNIATHKAEIGNYIAIIANSELGVFLGEMSRLKNVNKNTWDYILSPAGNKLAKIKCGISPIVQEGIIRIMDAETGSSSILRDVDETFGNYATRIVSITKNNYRSIIAAPSTAEFYGTPHEIIGTGDFTTPVTLTATEGDVDNLYFYDETQILLSNRMNNNLSGHYDVGLDAGFTQQLRHHLGDNDITNLDSIKITLVVSFRKVSRYGTNTINLFLYNVVDDYHEFIEAFKGEEIGGNSRIRPDDDSYGLDECVFFRKTVTIDNPTDYLRGTSNYIDVLIGVPTESIIGGHTIHTWFSNVEFVFSDDIQETQGQYLPSAPAGTTDIPFTTDANFPALPLNDAININDRYKVVKTVEDFLTDVFAISTFGLAIEQNITDADITAIPTDYTDKYIIQLLRDVTNKLNAIWWIDPVLETLMIKSLDNLLTVDYTLTYADVYNGRIFFDFDGKDIKENITATGRSLTSTTTIAADISKSLGAEDVVYTEPTILDIKSLDDFRDAKKVLHKSLKSTVSIHVDLDTGDYSGFSMGKLIPCKFPNASDPYILDDTLLIAGIGYTQENSKPIVVFKLEKRFT